MNLDILTIKTAGNDLTYFCHGQARENGWWTDMRNAYGVPAIEGPAIERNTAFDIAYIASGIALARPLNDESLDPSDIYTSGIFDGEGHIGINKVIRENGFAQYTTRCQVASTDFELIDALTAYGGVTATTGAGRWNQNASAKKVWNIHSQQAAKFLMRIGPLLRSNRKREAARLALAVEMSRLPKGGMCSWAKDPSIHGAREVAYQRIKIINSDKSLDRETLTAKDLQSQLADAVVRIFDLAGGLGLDVAGAIAEKLIYNASREDHKLENRRAIGGKQF
jgi:hypothetical protein